MFLKSLVIRGFKSFADRATLDFEPGITVVVGPNGSGKSNVVDAIAWVLGAQAPTAVRSQRMDDVIFAGTSSRPALGRAEVSLTIDNSSGYLPMDFNEVSVRRTLFRSGDSEYAINGVPCRLLDVQELLSDAGVGRQQHVIANQGQLDAILNARPDERRAIIEEAAGVLKHRKRRERSERRLAAAEADLTRVGDLQREVRRQVRPLERQAEAARRAERLGREARALRRLVSGREIAALEARAEGHRAEQAALEDRSVRLGADRDRLDAEIAAAQAALAEAGNRQLADAVARAATVGERARGLAALLAERRRAGEREAARAEDRSALALLDAELAQVAAEAAEQEAEAARLTAERDGLVREQAGLDLPPAEPRSAHSPAAGRADGPPGGTERAPTEPAAGPPARPPVRPGPRPTVAGDLPPAGPQLAELRRELAGVQAALDQRRAELGRLGSRRQQLAGRAERLRIDVVGIDRADEGAEDAEEGLARTAEQSERQLGDAEQRLARAEAAHREAEADHRGWRARVEALGQALEEVRARAGAARLAGQAGVLGVLLDVIEVDPGWEAAVEAASGDALTAVVVEDTAVARAALEALDREGASGAVLPAPGGPLGRPRSAARPAADGVGEAVAGHVRARRDLPVELRAAVDRLVEVVVGDAVRVTGGWPEAADAADAADRRADAADLAPSGVGVGHGTGGAAGGAGDGPAPVLVTEAGDRFSATGWRLGAARARATGELQRDAERRAGAARAGQEAAAEAHAAARTGLERARRAHQQAVRAGDEHAARRREADAAARRTRRDLADMVSELAQLDRQIEQLEAAVAEGDRRRREVVGRLPALEAAATAEAAEARAQAEAEAALDRRRSDLARRRGQVEARAGAVAERRAALDRRRAGLEQARQAAGTAARDAEGRRAVLARRLEVEARLEAVVAERRVRIDALLIDARARLAQQAEQVAAGEAALAGLRRRRAGVEAERAEATDRARRVELALTEATVRLETAREAAERDLAPPTEASTDAPSEAVDAPDLDHDDRPDDDDGLPLADGVDPLVRLAALDEELRRLGPVNPLAAREHAALVERLGFLDDQVADVRESRRELARVVRAIDEEINATFAAAYADVGGHFTQLFATLFPGGHGALRLTDPDDLGATGVDVEARPSGKNVRKLSLLSGGERALTALGLLFAVFRSRPSPFYVLDEVEAALDDVNLRRFLELLEEFRPDAQLIVVSHQKRTMEVADCLYGVTMKPGGSSVVVSERIRAAS